MGQAKQRGTFEQRRAEAITAQKIAKIEALVQEPYRRGSIAHRRPGSARAHSLMALAAGIVAATEGGKHG